MDTTNYSVSSLRRKTPTKRCKPDKRRNPIKVSKPSLVSLPEIATNSSGGLDVLRLSMNKNQDCVQEEGEVDSVAQEKRVEEQLGQVGVEDKPAIFVVFFSVCL
ncbi:hypothetical protein K1719_035955 [Acacia pycnantha]|nr:hypothetical protein K1719_035955 [Acacia pycnantha]